MENVNKQWRNFILFLKLDMAPWNSTSGEFAYSWQSTWIGIIAIKTERTQVHFLSGVLVAVASFDLKAPIAVMSVELKMKEKQLERIKTPKIRRRLIKPGLKM